MTRALVKWPVSAILLLACCVVLYVASTTCDVKFLKKSLEEQKQSHANTSSTDSLLRQTDAPRGDSPPPPPADPYATHINNVLKGCGDVCRIDMAGTPSLFFDYISKRVDCDALMSNAAIDAAMAEPEPPQAIPTQLIDAFTYNGKIPVKYWLPDNKIFNQRYLEKNALTASWDVATIDSWSDLCSRRELPGTYGITATNEFLDALKHITVQNATILVIGSERPWVEACLLSLGAHNITTLEYGDITSKHPRVHTLTPGDLRLRAPSYKDLFDAVVTYSSVEHSGLGRYGDAMNPWGDRQAVARAWCMTKPGGRILIGLPAEQSGADTIYYNAHRSYGKIQLPHLLANWKQIWQSHVGIQQIWVGEKEASG